MTVTSTTPPLVSVIIPVRDAAATIGRALGSLCVQTFSCWEAIVIDDGSEDETAAAVLRFPRGDACIRLIRTPRLGVSRARNEGTTSARGEWLLFLDADDELLPHSLDRLTAAAALHPAADVISARYFAVGPDGSVHDPPTKILTGDAFVATAKGCPFAIRCCLVRRSVVKSAGGFDSSYTLAEDWDLWQRIARGGAQFYAIPDILARYYLRSDSGSANALSMARNALRVIETGHQEDPRVPNAAPQYAKGAPAEGLASTKLYLLCWCYGQAAALGQDAESIRFPDDCIPESIDQARVAESVLLGMRYGAIAAAPFTRPQWQRTANQAAVLFKMLGERLESSEFSLAGGERIADAIVDQFPCAEVVQLGTLESIRIEVTCRIPEAIPVRGDRLRCVVEMDGQRLGGFTIPVFGRFVTPYILSDAISAEFSWIILKKFLEATIYPELRVEREGSQYSVYRGDVKLATQLAGSESGLELHDTVGWTVLLQEIWGKPEWDNDRFYQPHSVDGPDAVGLILETDGIVTVEASAEFPTLRAGASGIQAVLTIGGNAIASVRYDSGVIPPDRLRKDLSTAAGFEMCRAAVRGGIVGHPLAGGTLRERLCAAAKRRFPVAPILTSPAGVALEPRASDIASRALGQMSSVAIMLRRRRSGFSSLRNCLLPAAIVTELAQLEGVPTMFAASSVADAVECGVYAPELFWTAADSSPPATTQPEESPNLDSLAAEEPQYGRSHFEQLYASNPDPWDYENVYECVKYEQTLSLIPAGIATALEIACAEGHFTRRLAPNVRHLVAADISEIALSRAAERCKEFKNVLYRQLDLREHALTGSFELVVCSEVLYFMGSIDDVRLVGTKFSDALAHGGYLLTAHSRLVSDGEFPGFVWELPFGGKTIGEVLGTAPHLHLWKEIRTPLYRVQLFRKGDPPTDGAEVIDAEMGSPLPEKIVGMVRDSVTSPVSTTLLKRVTSRLPILMYHRVAPEGSEILKRYRVEPGEFERQMRYLADTGYRSATLDEWAAAVEARRPLPGRAVLLSFDDGYSDFAEHAAPILRRYGFSALVFLVSDCIGKINAWDASYEEINLLSWDEIRTLQEQGFEFGTHGQTHRSLASLTALQAATELAHSRIELAKGLGRVPAALAYPYGAHDGAVERMAGACGYDYALSTSPGRCHRNSSRLALPRIEIRGSDTLADFVLKVAAEED